MLSFLNSCIAESYKIKRQMTGVMTPLLEEMYLAIQQTVRELDTTYWRW